MTQDNPPSAEDALTELAKVQAILSNPETPLDALIENLERATVLLQICQIKLNHSREEALKLMETLERYATHLGKPPSTP